MLNTTDPQEGLTGFYKLSGLERKRQLSERSEFEHRASTGLSVPVTFLNMQWIHMNIQFCSVRYL